MTILFILKNMEKFNGRKNTDEESENLYSFNISRESNSRKESKIDKSKVKIKSKKVSDALVIYLRN